MLNINRITAWTLTLALFLGTAAPALFASEHSLGQEYATTHSNSIDGIATEQTDLSAEISDMSTDSDSCQDLSCASAICSSMHLFDLKESIFSNLVVNPPLWIVDLFQRPPRQTLS
ncbi:hypothetical protein [Motiliproteus sp. MSK22-1]|uniref:hypothetical protein n=1 Tax=Motiliproteus sp. MSK22-1 TaxID=1897630 RepID=UPI0009760E2A|nr:hypothetical protein [Motiliproteus sp. MSK22-1]OMH31781.1 hypothetical protein BGP75_16840 [Motiliproteus sp. MSK22-1]